MGAVDLALLHTSFHPLPPLHPHKMFGAKLVSMLHFYNFFLLVNPHGTHAVILA